MKNLFCLGLLLCSFFAEPARAAVASLKPAAIMSPERISPSATIKPPVAPSLSGMNVITERSREITRLSLNQRLVKKLFKWQRKFGPGDGDIDPRKLRLGKLALILGGGAFLVALIPVIGVLSFPMAITAIVLGSISVQGNSNINGILGIVLGGLFLLIITAIIIAFVVSFSFF